MSIEELMLKLNGNGKIADKETAIELLKVSSKAWELLSTELKKDEEVMLYYQPDNYVANEFGPEFGCYIQEGSALYCDKAFELKTDTIKGKFSEEYISSIVPKCVLKKSNSFVKAYLNVQKKLKTSITDSFTEHTENSDNPILANMHCVSKKRDCIYGSSGDGFDSFFTVYGYDKSNLSEIVYEEYQQYCLAKRR